MLKYKLKIMEFIFYSFKKTVPYITILSLIFFISLLGFVYPVFNYIFFWLIFLSLLYFSFKNIKYGVFVALIELILGSKGYLFSFPVFGYVVSLRQAIFVAIILSYAYKKIRTKKILFLHTSFKYSFLLFVLFIFLGLIYGLAKNNPLIVFYDFNAYLYFTLIFPFFEVLINKENLIRFMKIMSVSAISLAFITLILFVQFSVFHYSPSLVAATKIEAKQLEELESLALMPENARLAQTTKIAQEKLRLGKDDVSEEKPVTYRWLKDTGIGEVSYLGGRFFRIFMPNQFFIIIHLLVIITFLLYHQTKIILKHKITLFLVAMLYFLIVLISFSRSFWLGLFFALIYLIIGLKPKKLISLAISAILLIIILMLFINIITPDIFEVIKSRVISFFQPSSELAASNRVNLLKPILEQIQSNPLIGSGFGTLIVFKSLVPGTDLVEYIKVYLYEWAYLDIMVKIGILGLLAYLYFIFKILKSGLSNLKYLKNSDYILNKALISGLIFLLFVHFTTPFLNHPLGIGYIIMIIPIFYYYYKKDNEKIIKSIH